MMFLYNFVVICLAASVCVKAEKETELVYVPPYTTYLEDTLLATMVLKHDLKQSKPESEEFLKIYTAVIDLADQVAEKGENAYPEFYMETAKNAIKQVIDNPTAANDKLWKLVNNTNKELVKILSFVLYKQITKCALHLSYECNSIIASGLHDDPDLKQRADLLEAGGKHGKIFLDISNRFRTTSKSGHYDAEQFLVTGSDVMKPLVLSAYETRKVAESLKH